MRFPALFSLKILGWKQSRSDFQVQQLVLCRFSWRGTLFEACVITLGQGRVGWWIVLFFENLLIHKHPQNSDSGQWHAIHTTKALVRSWHKSHRSNFTPDVTFRHKLWAFSSFASFVKQRRDKTLRLAVYTMQFRRAYLCWRVDHGWLQGHKGFAECFAFTGNCWQNCKGMSFVLHAEASSPQLRVHSCGLNSSATKASFWTKT